MEQADKAAHPEQSSFLSSAGDAWWLHSDTASCKPAGLTRADDSPGGWPHPDQHSELPQQAAAQAVERVQEERYITISSYTAKSDSAPPHTLKPRTHTFLM